MLHRAHFTHFHSGGRAAGTTTAKVEASKDFVADIPSPKQIYADNAIPGEEAEIAISRKQRGFRLAVVHRVVSPSQDRVTPFCPHAELCGGCNWQHIAYPAQLHWKREILINALKKYDIKTPFVPEPIPSPLLQRYRNKSEYAFSDDETPCFGFHPKEDPAKVFPCQTCFLQPPHVHATAQKVFHIAQEMKIMMVKTLQIRTTTTGGTFCILGFCINDPPTAAPDPILPFLTRLQQTIPQISGWFYSITDLSDTARPFYPNYIHFAGATHLEEVIDDTHFTYSPQSFFQPNPLQAAALYRYIADHAQLTGTETLYDLYTGAGTIACFLAPRAKQVIGIEGNPIAIGDARINAALNNLHNTQFITGDILETFTPSFIDSHPKPNLIILDPPRSGTLIEIKKAIRYAAPEKIIYVSCNPVSLAWDLKQLYGDDATYCHASEPHDNSSREPRGSSISEPYANGEPRGSNISYRVTALQPFDMFPHTHHVESVCVLEKFTI